MPNERPHWERGYRCHGLWLGERRIGFVGLGIAGLWDGLYRWSAETPEGEKTGSCRSLATAKRQVERLFQSME